MATPEMIRDMANELMRALEVNMDPAATQLLRQEAYTAIEQFKECSPCAAQVGLFLIQSQRGRDFIVHFGLQLMEHCVRYRWNQLAQSEKVYIKENSMTLLVEGTHKETHIKDALARIIVEMIKREWPQHWPTLLHELNVASVQGPIQAEVVLFILLRLCEDVAVLQTLESTQRRKDLYQALTTNMGDIFKFILHLITLHSDLFKTSANAEESQTHFRVVQAGLNTLSTFVEWVNMTHISAENNRVLAILCTLIKEDIFQCDAAECLLQIVNRRGTLDDRKSILDCFDLNAIRHMLTAANVVFSKRLTDLNYLFLKKLTLVLTGLGNHFVAIWGKETPLKAADRSEHLNVYLDVMLTFSRHPSLTIVSYTTSLWSNLFKHPTLSRDAVFQKYIPQWVETTAPKIIRVSYPASRIPTTDQDLATILDFDSDDEFSYFLTKTRTDILETFRKATDVAPYVTYTYVEKWFRTVLQQSTQQQVSTNESSFCNIQSPIYLQWDAMTNLLDRVLNRLVHLESQARPSILSGLELLDLCLNFNPTDPLILSVLLSCISALFVFLSMATAEQSLTILPRVLDKIFSSSVFELSSQTKENRSRAVKNVRRHAGALLVKIGQRYPLLLLPLFDQIHSIVVNLNKENRLSRMEQVTLQEALILICNHFYDYNKQTAFVGEVMRAGLESWVPMEPAFRSPQEFMKFVGLDKTPVQPSMDDTNGQNRSQIVFFTQLIHSVIIRSTWPDDPDRAGRGGFVAARTATGNPIYRNPAAPHVLSLLPSILSLIKVLHALFTIDAQNMFDTGYKTVLQMIELEKANLLGLPIAAALQENGMNGGRSKIQKPRDRMQQFLHEVHESCYHIIGNAGPSLGHDFFQMPQLAQIIVSTVFTNLDFIPDYRLRPIIRTFLRNFIASCPKVHYDDVLLPTLSVFFPYMLTRLTVKWEYLTQLLHNDHTKAQDDDAADEREILEEKLLTVITREYTDVIKICLIGGASASSAAGAITDSDPGLMDQDDMDGSQSNNRNVNQVFTEAVSELGILLIRSESTCQYVLLTLLRLLTWNDSGASLKAAGLLHSVIRQLAADDLLNTNIVTHIITNVLQALQIHGQYEPIQGILLTLGAQLYEMFRPKYPCILEIMMQIPNINQQDLRKFDEKIQNNLSQNHKGNKLDKSTRDMFRKITASLVGRNISQLFRKEVKIIDLPKLNPRKKKKMNVDEFEPNLTSIFNVTQ